MLQFSGNIQNINIFGVPPNTLPYVMYIMIICLGQYCIRICNSKQLQEGLRLWWCFLMISCTFWRSRIFFPSNSPKLSCGLKLVKLKLKARNSTCAFSGIFNYRGRGDRSICPPFKSLKNKTNHYIKNVDCKLGL